MKPPLALTEDLPTQFPFYHLGRVERSNSTPPLTLTEIESLRAVVFEVFGEQKVWLALLFEPGLDPSMYSELGNILAARFADSLSRKEGESVLISPPKSVESKTLIRMIHSGNHFERAQYIHQAPNGAIEIEALIFTSDVETLRSSAHA